MTSFILNFNDEGRYFSDGQLISSSSFFGADIVRKSWGGMSSRSFATFQLLYKTID